MTPQQTAQPPSAPIIKVSISAQPVKPRASQTGLFIPLAPEPEKLEITLARLAKLVGGENVGSPESLDTHRPDSFRMKRFRLATPRKKSTRVSRSCSLAGNFFRRSSMANKRSGPNQRQRFGSNRRDRKDVAAPLRRPAQCRTSAVAAITNNEFCSQPRTAKCA